MLLLGIESSCDETAAAVVDSPRHILSSVVDSQIPLHQPHGGVVPEIASRRHVEVVDRVVDEALARAGVAPSDLTAVAATRGPGLASSLLIGWSAAKGLAARLGVPLLAVHHVAGHLYSPFLAPDAPDRTPDLYPYIGLAVSGGHTGLYRCEAPGKTKLLARTVDDAAGEALDKAAKLLGLSYPGGPVIDRLARSVEVKSNTFPPTRLSEDAVGGSGLRPELCFSFSGLKTSLRRRIEKLRAEREPGNGAEESAPSSFLSESELRALVSEYQEAVVDAILERAELALRTELPRRAPRMLVAGGGVTLNSRLRERLAEMCGRLRARLLLALPAHCGDNAAMIAGAAAAGEGRPASLDLDVDPTWPI